MRYLKLLYSIYPANANIPEYRHALLIAKKYSCRKILDIGCGKGNLGKILSEKIPNILYVGVDINNSFKYKNWNIEYITADARNLPVKTGEFDCIFFVNSIFYIGLGVLDKIEPPKKIIAIIDIDPRYLHVWLADKLESRFKGMRLTKSKLIKLLAQKYRIIEEGGKVTYYIVISTGNTFL